MEVGVDKDGNEDEQQEENMRNGTHFFMPEILTRTVVSMVMKGLLPSYFCSVWHFGLSR